MTFAKQVAEESKALCSIATSGKHDCVFASYMMEELCPKIQKVDHTISSVSTSGVASDSSNFSNSLCIESSKEQHVLNENDEYENKFLSELTSDQSRLIAA
ncbi:unnamed protein product [Rhizophagus irregularis]|uniref:Uncharacterized protein n=1 Tax=Rhizophagus irregularis TaxID=588596 RepID=A0A915ZHR7_9GLOM|nr:unnamed protein product [Rhizophagus irregularis]CAB5375742.1 unnamed protein product [Rhizophagus irregularis]